MKPIESGVYKFDSAILAAEIARALGNNSQTSMAGAFSGRKVVVLDGAKINAKASLLLSNAINQSRCYKISAASEVSQSKKNEAVANQKATSKKVDKTLEKDGSFHQLQVIPELRGLALKPKDAELLFETLEFDGVGNIIGAKRQLTDSEVKDIQSIAIAPPHLTNSSGERTHSKTPVESILYFNHYLEKKLPDEVAKKWQDNIREFWLRGNISADRLKSFFQLALKDFEGDHEVSREIGMLLKELEKTKYPTQLYDNVFGRIFSSELGRDLVENPTKESLETSRMIADEIKKDVAEFDEHSRKKIAGFLKGDSRFWFPKCPSLGVFMDDPTLDNLNNCLSKIENGFDVIKISKLLVCVLVAKNHAHVGGAYLSKANQFYSEVLLRIRNSDNLIDAGVKLGGTIWRRGKAIIKRDDKFKANSYGSKLRFHPRNDEDAADFVYSISVPDTKTLNYKNSSVFEKNMLRSGQSFGIGISGTTNLSCFFYEGLAKTNDGFSKDQAFLNTLAFVIYDGGHSIAESLAVFKAVSYLEQFSFKSDDEKYQKGKEIIESSLVNFKDLVKCGNSDSQEYILQSLNKAYDEMTKSYREISYSANKRDL